MKLTTRPRALLRKPIGAPLRVGLFLKSDPNVTSYRRGGSACDHLIAGRAVTTVWAGPDNWKRKSALEIEGPTIG